MRLEKKLDGLKKDVKKILKKISEEDRNKTIGCNSCDQLHKIKTLKAIQTHWYVQPHGCTGGDYWNEGEMQFICPKTGVVNRLLFNNDEIPWEKRQTYEFNPEEQFKSRYSVLFKEVENTYKDRPEKWVNNFYVDTHRKKFGLVEKSKDDSDKTST